MLGGWRKVGWAGGFSNESGLHEITQWFCQQNGCLYPYAIKNSAITVHLWPWHIYFTSHDIAGVLELKEETIESLLAAACLLQLSQVIQVCCNFLMKQLHPSNCLGIRSFADAQGCADLLLVAHNYTMVGRLGWMWFNNLIKTSNLVAQYFFLFQWLQKKIALKSSWTWNVWNTY